MNFEPRLFNPAESGFVIRDGAIGFRRGPGIDDVYVYSNEVILAINVALATARPLLISGEPGSGKSSLGLNAASVLRRAYYERVITSRTQALDLLWNFDALRRLSDATAGAHRKELPPTNEYVEPGPVWWAFDPFGAVLPRGKRTFADPGITVAGTSGGDAVLLIDEIDKADPDVPNDLLEPFGAKSFIVRETGEQVSAKRDVLLILTTNGERELPPAFLRRCVVLAIEPPTEPWFVEVARQKFGNDSEGLHARVAKRIMDLRRAAKEDGYRPPGTAEFLDAIQACNTLGVKVASEAFEAITLAAAWKQPGPARTKRGA